MGLDHGREALSPAPRHGALTTVDACSAALSTAAAACSGNKVGLPHTVPCKLTGKCGSVTVRLIPAPRGTGIVAAPVPKKLLAMAGIKDVYTQRRGHSSTLGNFCKAVYFAVSKSYGFLDPTLWKKTHLAKSPHEEHSDFLIATSKKAF